MCPWRIEIVRVVLLGTHDAQSPLHQLQGQRSVLELIIRGWAWPEVLVNSARLWAPELFLDVLMAEMLAANPGVTEAKLREGLGLNPDGSIHSWHLGGYLSGCGLRARMPVGCEGGRAVDCEGCRAVGREWCPASSGMAVGGSWVPSILAGPRGVEGPIDQ